MHLLIHDEAHWGIAEKSTINNFLDDLSETIKNLKEKIYLLIVLVSATIDVLTKVRDPFQEEERRLDWKYLREKEPKYFQSKVKNLHEIFYNI